MNHEWVLPSAWKWATFDAVAAVESDLVDPAGHLDAPHIAPNHIESGTGKLLPYLSIRADGVTSPKHRFRPGQILYSKIRPYLAKAVRADFEGLCSADMYPVRADINTGYLHQWLISPMFTAWASESQGRTVLPKINQEALATKPVPVAPINEQKRIVAKIEALQARSDAAKEALDAIPPLLEKFRQSVLAAAFRGDLTKKWREAHPQAEPASELLRRIRAERRRKWLEANPRKQYVEPEAVDTEGLPELAEGWCWAELGLLGEDPFATVQTGPFGAQLHNTEFTESGVPVIAVGNLTGMGFTRDKLYFVSDAKADQLSRYDVQAGDVLFARSGATLGKVCVAPAFVKDWRMTGHILRARFNLDFVLPEVVVLALAGCPAVVGQVKAGVRGMTRPGYNTGLLEGIVLPIPPLAEQVALLARVQDALDQVGGAAAATRAGMQGLTVLNQSILAKAFRGELVPQDPTDEPASVLLERIRREREGGGDPGTVKRGRGRPKAASQGAR